MPVIITAKVSGFRRCGQDHPNCPVKYEDGTFTDEQLATLKAEPMLVVQELTESTNDQKSGGAKQALESMNKRCIVAYLTERGVSFNPEAERPELLALAVAERDKE